MILTIPNVRKKKKAKPFGLQAGSGREGSFYKTDSEEGDREFPSQFLMRQNERGALTAETAGDPGSSDALDPGRCSRNSHHFRISAQCNIYQ